MSKPLLRSIKRLLCRHDDWIHSAPGWKVRKCCRRCGETRV